MSQRKTSIPHRKIAIAEPILLTLADAAHAVRGATDLTDRQRQDIASAIKTFGRVVDRQLDTIPLQPELIRELFASAPFARSGMAQERWTNIRSLLLKGCDRAGMTRLSGRANHPMSSEWASLLLPLPQRPDFIGISPFARYCSQRGIEPKDVSQEVFDTYGRDLLSSGTRSRPREAWLTLRRAWNHRVQIDKSWPQVNFEYKDNRVSYLLPWASFPSSLKADIDAMVVAATRKSIASRKRVLVKVSAETRRRLLHSLASAHVASGGSAEELKLLADLVVPKVLIPSLEHILDRQDKATSVHVHQIAAVACAVARSWVKVPSEVQAELDQIRKNVKPESQGMTDKNRATLRQFEDEVLVARLLTLPDDLVAPIPPGKVKSVRAAMEMQIALAIALLLVAPVRIKNLSSIDMERNLVPIGTGRRKTVHVHFPRADVKNHVTTEFPLPKHVQDLLVRYIRDARPKLTRRPTAWLFPGEADGHKDAALLSTQIADTVFHHIGVRVTAHQFRHLAGFLYLKDHPGEIEVVRQLLGHRSINTTLKFYAGMNQVDAARRFEKMVERRRTDAPLSRRRRGGRSV